MSKAPHHQAAFINAITEEGTKSEAVRYLQETWNELCEARARIRELEAAKGLMVKRLKWKKTIFGYVGHSIIGKYEIYPSADSDQWLWRGENGIALDQYEGKADGPGQAIDAAQADYERRIRAVITPTTVRGSSLPNPPKEDM